MGMFDYLKCERQLKEKKVQDEIFQTKDFACSLDFYIITKNGKLLIKNKKGEKPKKFNYHGDIKFYTSTGSHNNNSFKWYEYKARFTEGKLKWIRRIKKEVKNL